MKNQPRPTSGCRGFVPCVYEGLSTFSKYFSRGHFAIGHCSLVEFIGVDWATRFPLALHEAYLTEVFDTLAGAGNDEAACAAFELIAFHIMHTQAMMWREGRPYMQAGAKNLKKKAYHVMRPSADFIRAKLRNKLLQFIRARFWMMPVEPDKSGFGGADWQKNVERTERFLMLRTRKAMATEVIRGWQGTPRDENDELAFTMLSDMTEPRLGVCLTPAHIAPYKELIDHIHVTLSESLPERAQWANNTLMGYDCDLRRGAENPAAIWLYWLCFEHEEQSMSRYLRATLAKNRARLLGPDGLADELADALMYRSFPKQDREV